MNLVPAVDIEVSDSTLSTLSTNLEIEKILILNVAHIYWW